MATAQDYKQKAASKKQQTAGIISSVRTEAQTLVDRLASMQANVAATKQFMDAELTALQSEQQAAKTAYLAKPTIASEGVTSPQPIRKKPAIT